jgi:NAD(P)-dependent dehydrogenase (short-subunit alcohol dehydrogenase family)
MEQLRFDGRVAIVTGAGRGIGQAHAQLLAARGARVVLNDLGGQMTGGGTDSAVADAAVAEIVSAGGDAVANGSDIATPAGAQAVVDLALARFGRLDVVINNAGIYDVDEFPAMELDEVMAQLAVHVGGMFNVTRAAWPALIESGAGRVVMTTSTGALGGGNMVAYGAAKAGVIGLARALAMTGQAYGIKVNLLAPMALTRMMRHGMERSGQVALEDERVRRPALVSPLLAVLAHESCPVSGEMFVSGMRRYSRLFIAETEGYVHPADDLTPEDIVEHWDAIVDEDNAVPVPDTMTWSDRNTRGLEGVPL